MFRALHLSSARSWSSSHPGSPAGSIALHTHPLARDSSYLQRLRTFSMSACAGSSPSCNCAVPSSRRPPCTPKSQKPDPDQTSLWLRNCHQRLPKMFLSKIAVWNNSLSSSFFLQVSVKFKFYLVFFCWFVSSLIVFSIFPYCVGQYKSFHFWRTNLYYNYQLAQ